jgi:non-specific serine/threonine protein kinase
VFGEVCYVLTPLDTPSFDAPLEEIAASPAVRLFLERADDVGWDEGEGTAQLDSIAALCRFLDGLPLAIEMAATSTRTLSPAELLERLDRRLVLTDHVEGLNEHPRALRATIDWSHALLGEAEQLAFRRLAVFAAGSTLAGAEAVMSDGLVTSEAVVGVINRLVGASLLRPDQRMTPRRYRMLDTIREYAYERLVETGEGAAIRGRQVDYFVDLGMSVRVECRRAPAQPSTMALLDAEHDNIRETLERLIVEERGQAATRLAGAMGSYWNDRGHWGEGRRWLTRALALTNGQRSIERGRALLALAESTSTFSGIAATSAELEEAVDIIREGGDPTLLATALSYLANAYGWNGQRDRRQIVFSEAAAVIETIDNPWLQTVFSLYDSLGLVLVGDYSAAHEGLVVGAAKLIDLGDEAFASRAFMYAGNVARMIGDLQMAREDFEHSIAMNDVLHGTRTHSALTLAQIALELGDTDAERRFRQCMTELEHIGDERCVAICQRTLGSHALDLGRTDEAIDLLRSSLDALAMHDERSLAVALADIARIRTAAGDVDVGAQLVAAARSLANRSGAPLSSMDRERIERALSLHDGEALREPDLEAVLELARDA